MRMMTKQKTRICAQPLKVMMSRSSEALCADQRIGEVEEDAGGHDRAEDDIEAHGDPSQAIATVGIRRGEQEEAAAGYEKDEIEHGGVA